MHKALEYPFDLSVLLRRRRSLATELRARGQATEVRIALLGGSTTAELRGFLELFLLDAGLQPVFYESQYGKFEEEVLHDDEALRRFAPQIAVIHTTWINVRLPCQLASPETVDEQLRSELARFKAVWSKLTDDLGCTVIQNNFDEPLHRSLGGLDASLHYGRALFLRRLNVEFASVSSALPRVLINDIAHLSAMVGLERWHEPSYWFSYKLAVTPAATVPLAQNVGAIVRALFGKSRKCLILDLDNTLWGGVIGDDGVEGLRLGNETPQGEAYTAFQRYCQELKLRGVLLAVCSKNDPSIARLAFDHPDSVLRLEDFAAFKAGWGPKHEAIVEIGHELSLGLDSFVFVDDNPAERAIVAAQLPMVAVPDIGSDPARFIELLDRQLYFEPVSISQEDIQRAGFYESNVSRNLAQSTFANYGEFLDSLEMSAEVATFQPVYMDRIVQLTNKTNQFNLTTRRYTAGELELVRTSSEYIGLYGRLADKFGDNGLVTVVIGRVVLGELVIESWLMSCRVLKRDMELVMLDELVACAQARGLRSVRGSYIPTAKNHLVAEHYPKLGFTFAHSHSDGRTDWELPLTSGYAPRNRHIKEIARG